ncbi:DUF4062 domain-containing protein [Lysinibacillus sp. UGB7]|uniref:DUF4062 domain-containing protein n=1 Tax=Lysinibacillus sp. UGB7 TaxID=3411039 RepID=UPI003B7C30F3
MEKKLQVFVSSTYLDLEVERQKAVEAILKAGHIPAGMELFRSNNKDQWVIIEKWIKESDVLMLILGGKYGSVDPESGKSYTQLEYEYALENEIPVFAVVLKDEYLAKKHFDNINIMEVYEKRNIDAYNAFKDKVKSKYVSQVKNIDEIPNVITLALHQFIEDDGSEYHFKGWIRGSNTSKKEVNAIKGEDGIVASINVKNEKLIEHDENLLNELFKDIEAYGLVETIESVGSNCSYRPLDRRKIEDFVNEYRKPNKRLLDTNIDQMVIDFLNHLIKYTSYLSRSFFYRKTKASKLLYLYPDLNVDLDGSGALDEMRIFDKKLEGFTNITTETLGEIISFIHDSKIAIYS